MKITELLPNDQPVPGIYGASVWQELPLSSSKTLFTTAKLRWRPVAKDDPHGPQIATLWGDPDTGAFAAVVQSPTDASEVYTLIRRESHEG